MNWGIIFLIIFTLFTSTFSTERSFEARQFFRSCFCGNCNRVFFRFLFEASSRPGSFLSLRSTGRQLQARNGRCFQFSSGILCIIFSKVLLSR